MVLTSHLSEQLLDYPVIIFNFKMNWFVLAFIFLLIFSFIKIQSESMISMISALRTYCNFSLLSMDCQIFHCFMDIWNYYEFAFVGYICIVYLKLSVYYINCAIHTYYTLTSHLLHMSNFEKGNLLASYYACSFINLSLKFFFFFLLDVLGVQRFITDHFSMYLPLY